MRKTDDCVGAFLLEGGRDVVTLVAQPTVDVTDGLPVPEQTLFYGLALAEQARDLLPSGRERHVVASVMGRGTWRRVWRVGEDGLSRVRK